MTQFEFDWIIIKIRNIINDNGHAIVAIDGMSGSGKTTITNTISNYFDTRIIHCDDFFIPQVDRNNKIDLIANLNMDYKRFKDEIIDNLDKDIIYRKFNCMKQTYEEVIELKKSELTIIEGSYSLHPYFNKYYDYSIFIKIGKDKQLDRIKKRNGLLKAKDFEEKWIPLENKYFKIYEIEKSADIVINGDNIKGI